MTVPVIAKQGKRTKWTVIGFTTGSLVIGCAIVLAILTGTGHIGHANTAGLYSCVGIFLFIGGFIVSLPVTLNRR